MSHYVNTFCHPNTIDSTAKYVFADTKVSGTYIRPNDPRENSHERGRKNNFQQAATSYYQTYFSH